MPEVSIVIVTYNSKEDIAICLGSIYKNCAETDLEIIIADNNSTDGTVEILQKLKEKFEDKFIDKKKEVKLIINSDNKGYTLANNQCIAEAKGKYILLLNPDIILIENSIEKLIKRMSEVKADAIAPQLINPDYSIQPSCRTFPEYSDIFFEFMQLPKLFPRHKLLARWKMGNFHHDYEREVEQPMAASLLIKKSVLDKVGNFDERFEMFFNDVDLCKKIKDNGFKIFFTNTTKMIHLKGTSVYKDRKRMLKIWNQDCLRYFKKYFDNSILYNLLKAGLKFSVYIRK